MSISYPYVGIKDAGFPGTISDPYYGSITTNFDPYFLFQNSEAGFYSNVNPAYGKALKFGTTDVAQVGDKVGTVNPMAGTLTLSQATENLCPLLGRYPITGILNRQQYTEQFGNALGWGAVGAAVTANTTEAPNGTLTADTVMADGAASQHYLSSVATDITGAGTRSIYAKAGTGDFIQICTGGTADPYANFDLDNGTAQAFGTGTTAAINAVAGYPGWYRCEMYTPNVAAAGIRYAIVSSLASARLENFTSSASVIVWGSMTNTGTTAATYQKVTAAYDITESGIPSAWIDYGAGTQWGTFGAGTFGTATSGLYPAVGENWTLTEVFRTLGATGTITAQCGPTDGNKMFQSYVSSGTYRTRLRGTENDSLVTVNDGDFHLVITRCTNGVVTRSIDGAAWETLTVGAAAAETQNITFMARTESSAATILTGFAFPMLIDISLTDGQADQLETYMAATYGTPA